MNYWTKESLNMARKKGYLDELQEVYSVAGDSQSSVVLSGEQRRKIAEYFTAGKKEPLFEFLLKLKRFPYDEPFVGFLRQHPGALRQNPKTLMRIWERLERMGAGGVISGIERPMSPSRAFGQKFRTWLSSHVHSCGIEDAASVRKPASLDASDAKLAAYASEHLGYKRKKGLDLVMLGRRSAAIGEAKFISTTGGTQDKSFRESMEFVRHHSSGNAVAIAVIDGVVWAPPLFDGGNSLYARELTMLGDKYVVLSALLLPRFIKEL